VNFTDREIKVIVEALDRALDGPAYNDDDLSHEIRGLMLRFRDAEARRADKRWREREAAR